MAPGTTSAARPHTRAGAIVAAAGVIIACWMLLVPQGGQPDEYSHVVRSAALIGVGDPVEGVRSFHELPDRYLIAEPACYAFQPTVSAECSAPPVRTGDTVALSTRADDYPPGAHAVFGVAGLLPGLDPIWWGRIAAMLASTALVGCSLGFLGRHDRTAAAALLVGLTPMAWSILPSVNPSAFATAGATALWVGLWTGPWNRVGVAAGAVTARWLVTAGWVALTVSRRDGLIWACVVTAIVITLDRVDLTDLAGRLGRVALAVMGAATAVTCWWGITSDSSTSRLVVVGPIALMAYEGARRLGRRVGAGARWKRSPTLPRIALLTVAGAAATAAWVAVVATRNGGWDTDLALTVIAQTDENLVEAIGVMGWLDTVVPQFVVFGWLAVIGSLALFAAHGNRRALWGAAATLGIAAVSSWTFELLQGDTSGTYWQGRYSLPLLVGVPPMLARAASAAADGRLVRVVSRWSTIVGLGALNVGAWAAARRWGVGTLGSHLPWRWDTTVQPVHPLVLLVVLAAASAALGALLLTADGTVDAVDDTAGQPSDPAVGSGL